MTTHTELRVACIGAGYFSQFHYASWERISNVALVGACDQDIDAAKATRQLAFDDLETMIREVRPDLLDVILPPHAQAEAIRVANEAGVRAIICQKPFCLNRQEAIAITNEAKAAGTRLVIHENFRFQPWYRWLKTALQDDLVGALHQITFRLRPGDGQGSDAYLDRQPYFRNMERFLVHETAIHWIDTFRFLVGPPTAVYADLRRLNASISGEDAGFILFDHQENVRCVFDGNRHLDHAAENRRCTMGEALVEGSEGTLRLSGDGSVRHRVFGKMHEAVLLGASKHDGFGGDCVHTLQSHVVSAILNGTPLENEAHDYLDALLIEEAVYESASSGRKIRLGRD